MIPDADIDGKRGSRGEQRAKLTQRAAIEVFSPPPAVSGRFTSRARFNYTMLISIDIEIPRPNAIEAFLARALPHLGSGNSPRGLGWAGRARGGARAALARLADIK